MWVRAMQPFKSPEGKTMLIDAGPSSVSSLIPSYLKNLGISSLDVVVATHAHEDPIGGLASVLNGFTVGHFVDSEYPHTTQTYEGMLNLNDQKNVHEVVPKLSIAPYYPGLDQSRQDYPGCDQVLDKLKCNVTN
jgi:beta-lactamase superfamily II metal-dependent hydrolase